MVNTTNLDKPMSVVSIDTGDTIIITKDTMNLHVNTKNELIKYAQLYESIVNSYPEQELLLKSIISDSLYSSLSDIVSLPDYTITSYCNYYVEEYETSLIQNLQIRINNYKNIWLIPYYNISDNLFLPAQLSIFYNYLVTTILAIRQENCKTTEAHSFHIKNYLSSHLGLDVYYNYLTREQLLFLYRNILYLLNHAGINSTFYALIKELFTNRNISVINYQYNQLSNIEPCKYLEYAFRQKPVGDINSLYTPGDFDLSYMNSKESTTAPSNSNYYTYYNNDINYKLYNSLYNLLITKDLETILINATDSVYYRFMQTLVDNWVSLLSTDSIYFLVKVTDKINNKEIYLNQKDLFKLYLYLLHKINGIELKVFPTYTTQRVYRQNNIDIDKVLSVCYKGASSYRSTITKIVTNIPKLFSQINSSSKMHDYILSVYKFDLALWLFLSNLSDKDDYGQIKNMVDSLTYSVSYTPDQEDVGTFLKRVTLSDLGSYELSSLNDMLYGIYNSLFDGRLDFLSRNKDVQLAMVAIFNKLKSYSVQLINTYYVESPILSGARDTRYSLSKSEEYYELFYDIFRLSYENNTKFKHLYKYSVTGDIKPSFIDNTSTNIQLHKYIENRCNSSRKTQILLTTVSPIESSNTWDNLTVSLSQVPDLF